MSEAGLRAFYPRLPLGPRLYDHVAKFGFWAVGIAALYWTTSATLTACCGPLRILAWSESSAGKPTFSDQARGFR
ncbi:MAG TPA: hypothetical protein VHS80_10300, partial [Chthoniobacterales bacterium]|nr:hypothetical protein [Chthoniobacterales bacterium]